MLRWRRVEDVFKTNKCLLGKFSMFICEILYKLIVAIFTAIAFNSFHSSWNTIIICCIKLPTKLSVIPLTKGWYVVSRFRYSKYNMRIFKCNYANFYLHSFTFTIFLAGHTLFLKIFNFFNFFFFFWNEKLFGGFCEWPILMTVNLHLLELITN